MITIVLADPHHLIREGVRSLLEQRRKPRVLIMALTMPGLSSFEVILRVRQRSPETAVILLSIYAGDQYVTEALRSGASGYVMTQARGIELIRAIR